METTNMKIPCEVWCRVTGFFRPVKYYNAGKKQEFWDRTAYLESCKAKREELKCNQ